MAGSRAQTGGDREGDPRLEIESDVAADSPYAFLVPNVRKVAGRPGSAALWALPIVSRLAPHPMLAMLTTIDVPGVVMPAARLATQGADWLLCRSPAGSAVAGQMSGTTDEAVLISQILRPAAVALEGLRRQGLTHRAVRPTNLFIGSVPGAVELGPFWFAPPAHGQNAIMETPWVAACLPEARGPGSIADDVYALGVLILGLCLGGQPLDGVSDAEVIERKTRLGSYAALLGDRRVPPSLADLLSVMLADEPSQRPSPERLASGVSLAGPKVVSRRRVNAAVPLNLGETSVWTTPQLAYAIATTPDLAKRSLLLGQVNHWLRRCLNEVVLAEKLDSLVWPSPGASPLEGDDPSHVATALLRISRLLDPSAPIIWRGICLMPEGVAPLLASLDDKPAPERDLVLSAIAAALPFLAAKSEGDEAAALEARARRLRNALRTTLGRLHAAYELNPSLACRSTLLGGRAATTLAELLPAIEAEAAVRKPSPTKSTFRLDEHVIAFAAARRRPSRPPSPLGVSSLEQLRTLASIWQETRGTPSPGLAGLLAEEAMAAAASWPGREQRDARQAQLRRVIEGGNLLRLLQVIDDDAPLQAAQARREEAHATMRDLVRRRDALQNGGTARQTTARRVGQQSVEVVGVALSAITLLLQLIP